MWSTLCYPRFRLSTIRRLQSYPMQGLIYATFLLLYTRRIHGVGDPVSVEKGGRYTLCEQKELVNYDFAIIQKALPNLELIDRSFIVLSTCVSAEKLRDKSFYAISKNGDSVFENVTYLETRVTHNKIEYHVMTTNANNERKDFKLPDRHFLHVLNSLTKTMHATFMLEVNSTIRLNINGKFPNIGPTTLSKRASDFGVAISRVDDSLRFEYTHLNMCSWGGNGQLMSWGSWYTLLAWHDNLITVHNTVGPTFLHDILFDNAFCIVERDAIVDVGKTYVLKYGEGAENTYGQYKLVTSVQRTMSDIRIDQIYINAYWTGSFVFIGRWVGDIQDFNFGKISSGSVKYTASVPRNEEGIQKQIVYSASRDLNSVEYNKMEAVFFKDEMFESAAGNFVVYKCLSKGEKVFHGWHRVVKYSNSSTYCMQYLARSRSLKNPPDYPTEAHYGIGKLRFQLDKLGRKHDGSIDIHIDPTEDPDRYYFPEANTQLLTIFNTAENVTEWRVAVVLKNLSQDTLECTLPHHGPPRLFEERKGIKYISKPRQLKFQISFQSFADGRDAIELVRPRYSGLRITFKIKTSLPPETLHESPKNHIAKPLDSKNLPSIDIEDLHPIEIGKIKLSAKRPLVTQPLTNNSCTLTRCDDFCNIVGKPMPLLSYDPNSAPPFLELQQKLSDSADIYRLECKDTAYVAFIQWKTGIVYEEGPPYLVYLTEDAIFF